MNTMRSHLPLILLTFLLLTVAAGTAHEVFNPLEVSPRARAMGGAVAAVDGDAWSVYHNSALLPWMLKSQIAASTTQPNDGDYNRLTTVAGSVILPDNWGGMSFGLRQYGVDYKSVDLLSEYTI